MSLIQPVPDRDGLVDAYAYPDDGAWLRTNFVASVDGATADKHGRSAGLSPAVDRYVFALLRSLADVILVGAGTARQERYAPVRLDEVDSALRTSLGLAPLPRIAVVSASLDLPPALIRTDLAGRSTIVITTSSAPAERLAAIEATCDVLVAGDHTVDAERIPAALSERGLRRINCEGGPSLFGSLLEADVVDEACVTLAPVLTAGDAARIAHGNVPVERTLRLGHLLYEDDVLLARYVRDRSTS